LRRGPGRLADLVGGADGVRGVGLSLGRLARSVWLHSFLRLGREWDGKEDERKAECGKAHGPPPVSPPHPATMPRRRPAPARRARTSWRPSASSWKASTTMKIAAPGATEIHGASRRYE